jgi:hypothetical protein
MAGQPEEAFCALEFHSTESGTTVQRDFRREFYKELHVRIQYESDIIDFKTPVASTKAKSRPAGYQ